MGKAEERFKIILSKFKHSEIPDSEIYKLNVVSNFKPRRTVKVTVFLYFLIPFLIYSTLKHINLFKNSECLIDMPQDATKLFREPEFCDICQDVTEIEKIANISTTVFLNKYLKPAQPVVVTDGALNWTARFVFNFKFFKELFDSIEINQNKDMNCQFFPYKTEFRNLQEVFTMKEERAMLKSGEKPWYIGWNNCNDQAGRYLKQFYDTPYFLSNMTENIALSWIFMGGPGHGAHMHVDNVHYPSWQAQLRGKKLWKLAPPPECYYKCKELEVIVNPGEIIVLDTNRWYHQTSVLQDDVSITIGSEFD